MDILVLSDPPDTTTLYKLQQLFLGLRYNKTADPKFWTYRPLSEQMVRASADDVRFLLYIYQKMMGKLSPRSLWHLAVHGALYCRCFCISTNGYADWPPLPPIPVLYVDDHSNIWRNVVLPGGMPESLKHRIIISTKPPKEFLESRSVKDEGSISPIGRESSEEEIAELDADDKSDIDQDDEYNSVSNCKPSPPEAPEYKRPITIHAGKLKSGLRNVLKLVDEKVRRLSLNEQALEKAAASYGSDLVRFTQRNLLRVYPKGMRASSSNYKPILGWMHGAQMVAFLCRVMANHSG